MDRLRSAVEDEVRRLAAVVATCDEALEQLRALETPEIGDLLRDLERARRDAVRRLNELEAEAL